MKEINTAYYIDWSDSVNPWYDSLNDSHTHELHHAFYEYIQAIHEEDDNY